MQIQCSSHQRLGHRQLAPVSYPSLRVAPSHCRNRNCGVLCRDTPYETQLLSQVAGSAESGREDLEVPTSGG
jgi:hypothetical protein